MESISNRRITSAPEELLRKKLAYQNAVVTRACPPDRLLLDKASKEMEEHLRICLHCQERSMLLEELGEITLARFKFTVLSKKGYRPGALVSLDPGLSGWEGECYVNPPIVLLLYRLPKDLPFKGWRVAQTYSDEILMGPDDVPLGGSFEGFCEPWNTYTLPEEYLGKVYGQVSEDVLMKVLRAAEGHFEEIAPESVLFHFRTLELTVGSYLARRAIDFFLEKEKVKESERNLEEVLNELFPSSKTLITKYGPYKFLAISEEPRFTYALAAEAENGLDHFRLVSMHQNGIDIRICNYKITLQEFKPEGLLITGTIKDKISNKAELRAWWVVSKDVWIEADEAKVDPMNLQFRLYFRELSKDSFESGRLKILIVDHEQTL